MIRALPTLMLVWLPALAAAQVSVNPGALDALKPGARPTTTAKPPAHQAPRTTPTRSTRTAERPAPASRPAAPAPTPPVRVPAAPPASPVLAPPVTSAARPPAAPAPPPPVSDAAGDASKVAGGIRVTFGAGKSDLNPGTEAAIRALGQQLRASPGADVNVYGYATGAADDPSTPRRLSLSRALAVRALLMSEGIESTRIYVRALGASQVDGPADRVDATVQGVGTP